MYMQGVQIFWTSSKHLQINVRNTMITNVNFQGGVKHRKR